MESESWEPGSGRGSGGGVGGRRREWLLFTVKRKKGAAEMQGFKPSEGSFSHTTL